MKKILKMILLVTALCLVLSAFTGCELVEKVKNKLFPQQPAVCEHVWQPATCIAHEICSLCGAVNEESALADHTEVEDAAVEATCTTDGKTAGKHCSVCNETIVAQETIPAGHTLTDVAEQAATCTEAGYSAHQACSKCDYTEGKTEIPALEHDMQEVEGKEATCTEDGYSAHQACSRCDHVENKEVQAALDHDLQKVEALAPTCTEEGYTEHEQCSRCEYSLGKEAIAAEHTLVYTTVAPTATTPGNTTITCSACEEFATITYANVNAMGVGKHVLESSMLEGIAQGDYVDGQVIVIGDVFDCHLSAKYKTDGSNKTFEDEYSASLRMNFGGETTVNRDGDGLIKNGIVFTTTHETTVTVWWVSGGNGRQVALYNLAGEVVKVSEGESVKNSLYISTFTVPAGTYVLGGECSNAEKAGGNYFFKVEVEVADHTWTEATCTAAKKCSVCGATEGEPAPHADENDDLQCDDCSAYLLPEVGTAFHLSLYQKNLGKTLYFAGAMNGYYYATTEKLCEATDLYLEEAEGGYYIYFMSGETKNYLYIQVSGTYTNVKYGSTKDVWAFDEVLGVFTNDVNGTDYYIGTYKTFNTISASKLSFISGDKASTIGVSNFPTRIFVDNHTCSYSEATCTVLPTCSICGGTTGELAAHNSDVVVDAVDATCTSAGATAGTKCSVCGTVTSGCEATEKLPHTYVDGVCACSAECPHTDVAAGETCGVCGITVPAESEGGDVEVTTATATLTPNVTANISSFDSGADITSYTSLAGSEVFTLTVGDKTATYSNQVYLSTGGEIRLYSDASGIGNTLTITSTKKIVSIAITYSGTSRSGATFTIGGTTVAGGTEITEETITVNANSVTIANNKTSGQLRITSIVITYEE